MCVPLHRILYKVNGRDQGLSMCGEPNLNNVIGNSNHDQGLEIGTLDIHVIFSTGQGCGRIEHLTQASWHVVSGLPTASWHSQRASETYLIDNLRATIWRERKIHQNHPDIK